MCCFQVLGFFTVHELCFVLFSETKRRIFWSFLGVKTNWQRWVPMSNTDKHNDRSADHRSQNEDHSTPETIVIINCVLNVPLMLISILGNALVLAAIRRTPSIRSTPHMIMLCSLAVSDFLVGLIAQPIYIAEQLTEDRFIHQVSVMIGYCLSGVSFLTITAITVDRFMALHYHMRYATLVTEYRAKYTLIIIWLINLLGSALTFWKTRVHSLATGIIAILCLLICTFFTSEFIALFADIAYRFSLNNRQYKVLTLEIT